MESITSKLIKKKCVSCEGYGKALKTEELHIYRAYVSSDWQIQNNQKMVKDYQFSSYAHTIRFANKVAQLAEIEGHHPVMHVYFDKVNIELWTHAVDGLTENDFVLAAKIDGL
ncbi:MAG: 4a-hydroxytetrahydrobiopterin dehydratase [Bacteroidales bacterium]|nr:4a-hydroxytetrahydrobiopterin dehydratase [Bacteroidales bacterium]